MNHKKVFLFILPAIGAAILAVLSQLSFAFGTVPVTLQTFAIGLIATIFKPREAFLATVLYLLLGAIGLPVFAGGHGGLQALLGPTGVVIYIFSPFIGTYYVFNLIGNLFTHSALPKGSGTF